MEKTYQVVLYGLKPDDYGIGFERDGMAADDVLYDGKNLMAAVDVYKETLGNDCCGLKRLIKCEYKNRPSHAKPFGFGVELNYQLASDDWEDHIEVLSVAEMTTYDVYPSVTVYCAPID